MTDGIGRLVAVEHKLRDIMSQLLDILARLARAETNIQQIPTGGGAGGGATKQVCYCIGDGTAHVATGTWPSLTAATFTSDVYVSNGSALTLLATGATINWFYKDAMSTTAGKLIPCEPNGDGTTYDGRLESCLKVT